MADLIAQGPRPEDNWRRALPPGEDVVLGRDPNAWNVPWESYLSRRHAELKWHGGRLKVRKLSSAANPIFHAGKPDDSFELTPIGGAFVIGHTLFSFIPDRPTPSPNH